MRWHLPNDMFSVCFCATQTYFFGNIFCAFGLRPRGFDSAGDSGAWYHCLVSLAFSAHGAFASGAALIVYGLLCLHGNQIQTSWAHIVSLFPVSLSVFQLLEIVYATCLLNTSCAKTEQDTSSHAFATLGTREFRTHTLAVKVRKYTPVPKSCIPNMVISPIACSDMVFAFISVLVHCCWTEPNNYASEPPWVNTIDGFVCQSLQAFQTGFDSGTS